VRVVKEETTRQHAIQLAGALTLTDKLIPMAQGAVQGQPKPLSVLIELLKKEISF